jgi:hypothetical protein
LRNKALIANSRPASFLIKFHHFRLKNKYKIIRPIKTGFAKPVKGRKKRDIKLKKAHMAARPLLGEVGPALSSCFSLKKRCIHMTVRLKYIFKACLKLAN